MGAHCSICGGPLTDDAVTFAAGGVVLFRPCVECEAHVRDAVKPVTQLGLKKLGALVERVPQAAEFMKTARKAIRIARVVAEED